MGSRVELFSIKTQGSFLASGHRVSWGGGDNLLWLLVETIGWARLARGGDHGTYTVLMKIVVLLEYNDSKYV